MILPKVNSKKYIKTIIGIYILYVIVSPVISFATGHEPKLDYSVYEKCFGHSDEYKLIQSDFKDENNKYIVDTYKEEIKKQIVKTINDLDYYATNIAFDLDLKTGEISNLTMSIDIKDNMTNMILIDKIGIGNTIKKQEKNNLSKQEIEKIKNKLYNDYGINYEDIIINSI